MKKSFLFSILLGSFLILPSYAAESADATLLYNKGIDLYEQDKVEQSIQSFKKAIELEPEFYEAYYNLARIQEASGRIKDAIASYEKLLKIQPDDYESAYQFSEFLYKNGYLQKASACLKTIPQTSEYGTKAEILSNKIIKRQKELAVESQIKTSQTEKSSVIGTISAPSGLVVDSNGNMYVASFTENTIYKFSKDGSAKTVFADKAKEIDGPIGLAIDSFGNIYVANYNKGNVMMLNKNGSQTVLMYAKKPYCISLSEKDAKLYITEQQNNSVIAYDLKEILKASEQNQKLNIEMQSAVEKIPEKRVITIPVQDKNPIGTPSIIESGFTRNNPQTSITAPIMIPSDTLFDY